MLKYWNGRCGLQILHSDNMHIHISQTTHIHVTNYTHTSLKLHTYISQTTYIHLSNYTHTSLKPHAHLLDNMHIHVQGCTRQGCFWQGCTFSDPRGPVTVHGQHGLIYWSHFKGCHELVAVLEGYRQSCEVLHVSVWRDKGSLVKHHLGTFWRRWRTQSSSKILVQNDLHMLW